MRSRKMATVSCIAMMLAEIVCIAATLLMCQFVSYEAAVILALCAVLAIIRKIITIPAWIKLKKMKRMQS